MSGNDHAQIAKELLQASTSVTVLAQQDTMISAAGVHAQLAVAFELRTQNLLAAQATPEWLNEVRTRMGHDTFPPGADIATKAKAREAMLMQGADPGLDPVEASPKDPRCSQRYLENGRNEVRCWLKKDHDGECK